MTNIDVIIDTKKYGLTEQNLFNFSEEFYGKHICEIGKESNFITFTFEDSKNAVQFEAILNSTFLLPEKPKK